MNKLDYTTTLMSLCLFWFLQPSCAFPVSQDKEEKCRHVLSYVLKVGASTICTEENETVDSFKLSDLLCFL